MLHHNSLPLYFIILLWWNQCFEHAQQIITIFIFQHHYIVILISLKIYLIYFSQENIVHWGSVFPSIIIFILSLYFSISNFLILHFPLFSLLPLKNQKVIIYKRARETYCKLFPLDVWPNHHLLYGPLSRNASLQAICFQRPYFARYAPYLRRKQPKRRAWHLDVASYHRRYYLELIDGRYFNHSPGLFDRQLEII